MGPHVGVSFEDSGLDACMVYVEFGQNLRSLQKC